jgi:peptide/nickel transport system substrate-binding protein
MLKWIARLLVVVMAASVGHPALADKAHNTIRFAYDQQPESIDPFFNNVRIGFIIGQHVWDTLVYRDPTSGEYKGQLATAWRRVDERTVEFDLRKGVKFHNGQEFTAEDVVYTLNFVAKPENKVVTQANVNWIDHAEKIEPYKVRVVTKQPFPAMLEYLAGPVVIHPHEYYESVGPSGQNKNPIGSGPYRVASHVVGKSITLERNPDYFKDSPKPQPSVARIEIRFIPDAQTRMAEMMSNGLDFAMNVFKDQAEQMGTLPMLQVVSGETMRIAFLQINRRPETPTAALSDERVRKAINHAIDRDSMVKHVVGAGSRVINTICFPGQFGCTDEGATRYPYDPAKARQLLTEAGFPKGFRVEIVAYRERQQTEAIIGYLRAVGIDATLRFLQYPALREHVRANQAGLAHQTWGSFSVGDVSACTPVWFGFSDEDTAKDPEVRDLLKQGDTSIDPEARKDAYRKALSLIAERAYAVPLYSLPSYYVATADLNFKAYPDEVPRFWEMSWK